MQQTKKSISADMDSLGKLVVKINETFKQIEEMVSKGHVNEILKKEAVYAELKNSFESLKYLENISFDVLTKSYLQALLRDNEKAL